MPTADQKDFIVDNGLDANESIKLGEQTVTSLVDSALVSTVAREPANASVIALAGGASSKAYDSAELLPTSGNDSGDFGYVASTNRLYLWNGSGWYNIALVNTSPNVTTEPDTNYSFDSIGHSLIVTLVATDPEGLDITYTHTSDSASTFATISQDSGVFTITPLSQSALDSNGVSEGGTFSITFKATDGVNIVPKVSSFTLNLVSTIANSKYTSALITATATSDNNNLTDASSNNATISAYGDAGASAVSPYRHGGYSAYFGGSGGYANIAGSSNLYSAMDFGTDDYTVEFWMYPQLSGNCFLFGFSDSGGNDSSVAFALRINMSGSDLVVRFQNCNDAGTLNLSLQATGDYNYKWSHVAITRTGGNQKMYINGSQVATQTDASAHMRTPSTSFSIGRAGDRSAFYYKGYISDLRIVNGTAIYTGNFTAPTAYLEAVTNTKLLACRDAWYKDNSSNAWTMTVTEGAETRQFTAYDNLEYVAATHGGSIKMSDSRSDLTHYFTIPDGDWKTFGTDNFTIEFWFRPGDDMSNRQFMFADFNSGGTYVSSSITLYVQGNTLKSTIETSAATGQAIDGSTGVRPHVWHHAAMVRNGTTMTMYLNGISEGTYNVGSASINNSSEPMYLGKYAGGEAFEGFMSDIRVVKGTAVYTSTFTPPTAPLSTISGTSLHIKCTDASIIDKAQVSNLILNGNVTGSTNQIKFANTKSIKFDGSGDYIDISNQPLLDLDGMDFTVEAWVKLNNLSGPQTLIAFALPHATFQISLSRDGSGNTYIMTGNSNSNSWADTGAIQSSSALTAGASGSWHHVAVTVKRSNNTIVLYHDGSSVGSVSASNKMPNYMAGNVRIGSYNHPTVSPGEFLNGYVQDLRVSSYVRYTGNFTVPSAPLEG